MSTNEDRAGEAKRIWPELVELIPKLLWFALALAVFIIAYKPVVTNLRSGGLSKLSFATFDIEFARQDFARAAGQVKNAPPVQLKAYADQINAAGDKLIGAKGLWVSDDNYDPARYFLERRAFSSIGISFDWAKNNSEARELLEKAETTNLPYDFVITDIGRKTDRFVADCFPSIPGSPREAGCETVQLVKGYDEAHPIPVIVYSQDAYMG